MNKPQLERVFKIHNQIKGKTFPSVPKLAALCEVTTRTIERDLVFMRDRLGAPIRYNRARRGYEYADDNYNPLPLKLTEGELLAVFLGSKLLREYRGTTFEKPLAMAFEKIQFMLPNEVSVDTGLGQAISFGVEPLRGDERAVAEVFDFLSKAIAQRKRVAVRYYSASRDEVTERTIEPYCLHNAAGVWYTIGYCHLRQEVRVFSLDRISEIRMLEEGFQLPPDFSLAKYMEPAWRMERGSELVEVVLRFDSYQARWIREKLWHPSQVLEEQSDRSLIMRLTGGGLGEIKRWIMQFGSHAEVLAPPELRESVARELEAMRLIYENPYRAFPPTDPDSCEVTT